MVAKRRRIVERPSGIGKIFKGEKEIASASYLLDVVQTINISGTFSATTETPGLWEVRGRVKVVDGQTDLQDGKFVLELPAGRRWEFFATKGEPITGIYTVVMGERRYNWGLPSPTPVHSLYSAQALQTPRNPGGHTLAVNFRADYHNVIPLVK